MIRDECRCGHERLSHHKSVRNCLALLCACTRFRDPKEPDDKPSRPDHPSFCQCHGCKAAA